MRYFVFTLILSSNSLFLLAQHPPTGNLRTLTKLDLGLQGVGITFEPKIGKSATIDLSAGIGGGYDIYFNEFTYLLDVTNPAIYLSVTPKFFL